MSAFEHGDDTLIEELIKSGESLESIADKWDVAVSKLCTYCKRKGISIPNRKAESAKRAQAVRQAAERGEHISPVVAEILRLSKGCSIDEISALVKKNKHYVARIISVHKTKQAASHHTDRVNMVNQLCAKHDINRTAACQMMGISYGAYKFSKRQVDKYCNKKAPA